MELRRRIRGEDGIALIVSLIVLSLFMIIGAAVIDFSSANAARLGPLALPVQTHANAEGGIAAGLSRIYKAVDNPNLSTGYHGAQPEHPAELEVRGAGRDGSARAVRERLRLLLGDSSTA